MGTVNAAAIEHFRIGLQAIVNDVFEKNEEGEIWSKVATKIVSTGEIEDYGWLGDVPVVREWVGDRQFGDLKAYDYQLTNKEWEDSLEVLLKHIEDDKVQMYQPRIMDLAGRMMAHRDELAGDLLKNGFAADCYDGQYFFDTDHEVNGASVSNTGGGTGTNWFVLCTSKALKPLIMQIRKEPEFVSRDKPDSDPTFMRRRVQYGVDDRKVAGYGLWQFAYGSKDTLNRTNLKAAITAMESFTDNKGKPLGIKPDILVVPPSLKFTAKILLENEHISDGLGGWEDNECRGCLANGYISTAYVA